VISEKKLRNALADIVTPRNVKISLFVVFFLILFLMKKDFFIVLFFVALGAVSLTWRLFFDAPIGIELVTLSTAVCAMKYGSTYGAIVGLLAVIIGMSLNLRLFRSPMDTMFHIIGYTIMGSVLGHFTLGSLLPVGMAAIIIYNIIYIPFRLLMNQSWIKLGVYIISNIIFNYFIFSTFGSMIVRLVS
jgi:hypothetical protein